MTKMGGAFSRKPEKQQDFTPLYFQLGQELKQDIEEGRWAVGQVIPSARQIAKDRSLSLGTVQKAIGELVNAGYLYRVRGKGTFVAGTTIRRESLRYYRMRPGFNAKDPNWKIKVTGLEVIDGQPLINRQLQVRGQNKLYRLGRIFAAQGVPLVYSISYLPKKMFKDFETKAMRGMEKSTFYELVEKVYGMPTLFNRELFDLAECDQETADALGLDVGRPVLKIEMLSHTFKDRPYEYRISYCLTGQRRLYREID
jgi:GntR family transcriptional regulator